MLFTIGWIFCGLITGLICVYILVRKSCKAYPPSYSIDEFDLGLFSFILVMSTICGYFSFIMAAIYLILYYAYYGILKFIWFSKEDVIKLLNKIGRLKISFKKERNNDV